MIRFALAAILLLAAMHAFADETPPPAAPTPSQQARVVLPLSDWQAVASAISDSDRVSAHEASRILQEIDEQVRAQLVPAAKVTPKK